jgi:hypothetical protein
MTWFVDSGTYHRGVLSRGRVIADCGLALPSSAPAQTPDSADLICQECQCVHDGGPRRTPSQDDPISAAARANLADRVAAAARQFARWLVTSAGRGGPHGGFPREREDVTSLGRWARAVENNLWHLLDEEPGVADREVPIAVCGKSLVLVSIIEDEPGGPLCNHCAGRLLARGQEK